MLKESGLIELYRWMQANIEDNFCITHRTISHAKPKMSGVYEQVRAHMRKHAECLYRPGRTVKYLVKDALYEGMEAVQQYTVLGKRRATEYGLDKMEVDDSEKDDGEDTRGGIENTEIQGDDLTV